jgi:hypothetical protein
VLLELTLSNGCIRTLEMSVDKFNELRFSIAQVRLSLVSALRDCRLTPLAGIESDAFAWFQPFVQAHGGVEAALSRSTKVNGIKLHFKFCRI